MDDVHDGNVTCGTGALKFIDFPWEEQKKKFFLKIFPKKIEKIKKKFTYKCNLKISLILKKGASVWKFPFF